jgi:hypothetical protein
MRPETYYDRPAAPLCLFSLNTYRVYVPFLLSQQTPVGSFRDSPITLYTCNNDTIRLRSLGVINTWLWMPFPTSSAK